MLLISRDTLDYDVTINIRPCKRLSWELIHEIDKRVLKEIGVEQGYPTEISEEHY